jgi:alpha-N-arabinofuranosidase
MKIKSLTTSVCTLFVCASVSAGVTVKLDLQTTGAPISKYIYGQFIEHLGRSVNGGL